MKLFTSNAEDIQQILLQVNQPANFARMDNITMLVQAYFQAKLYSYITSKNTPHNCNNDERKLLFCTKNNTVTIKNSD